MTVSGMADREAFTEATDSDRELRLRTEALLAAAQSVTRELQLQSERLQAAIDRYDRETFPLRRGK